MKRFSITHIEKVEGVDVAYRCDIYDSEHGGSVQDRLAGETFFDWEYDRISEKDPFERPVQSSSFTCNFFVQTQSDLDFIEQILDSDEHRFRIEFFIDDVHKWSGNVLNDQLEYPEDGFPFTARIKAKDLSSLDGIDYDFVTTTSFARLSTIIADCLKQTGFNFPIRSFTNLTNSEVTQSSDFLYTLYHQKLALQDEEEPMSCLEVLENVCRAYNLIIRQSDARWLIEQLPAVAKGDDVQFDYDADGLNPVSSTPSRTKSINNTSSFILGSSQNIVTGALKSVESVYNHRTLIFNVETDDVTYTFNPEPQFTKFSLSFDNIPSFRMFFSTEVEVDADTTEGIEGLAYIRVRGVIPGSDDVYLTNAGGWSTVQQDVEITISGPDGQASGSFQVEDTGPIADFVTEIVIEAKWAEVEHIGGPSQTVTEVRWRNLQSYIFHSQLRDYSASVRNRYVRTGNYSVHERIGTTVLGDGPTRGDNFASKGRPASAPFASSVLTPGRFRIRGASENVLLEQITLRERINMRRKGLRNLQSDMWANYTPEDLISYDGGTWFFLGGHFSARDARWVANLLRLSYDGVTTGDTFQVIVDQGGDPSGITSPGPSTGGGLSEDDANAIYARRDNNLSDLNSASAGRDNLGLGDSDQVVFAELSVNAGGLSVGIHSPSNTQWEYLAGMNQGVATTDDVRFNDLELTGTIQYVNEDNLQVEDKTITVNKFGTNASAVGSGIIVERPGGNRSWLWQDNYWDAGGIPVAVGAATAADHAVSQGYSDGRYGRLTAANTWTSINDFEDGLTSRSYLLISEERAVNVYRFDNSVIDSKGNDNLTLQGGSYNNRAFSGQALDLDGSDSQYAYVTGYSRLNSASEFTITGAFLIRDLSKDDHVLIRIGLTHLIIWIRSNNNLQFWLRNSANTEWQIVQSQQIINTFQYYTFQCRVQSGVMSIWLDGEKKQEITGVDFSFSNDELRIGGDFASGRGFNGVIDEMLIFNRGIPDRQLKGLSTNPAGNGGGFVGGSRIRRGTPDIDSLEIDGLTVINSFRDYFGRDGNFSRNVTIDGLADITTAQIQTLRTTLFKPTTVSGMGGEVAFSAVSTVVSIDTDGNTIVVEDAVFSSGDSVIVSSAIYNQSGFSNVELNITGNGTSVSGGTQYPYSVNSGFDTDIDTGDSVTRVSGDLVYINATEGVGSPRIAGFDGLAGFGDSPFSGATADPVWELRPDGALFGGWEADNNKFFGGNSVGEFTGMQSGGGATLAFFAGADDEDGTDAKFYARADGRIFHDAIRRVLYSGNDRADYEGDGSSSAEQPNSKQWVQSAVRLASGTTSVDKDVIILTYVKRFGEQSVQFRGFAFEDNDAPQSTPENKITISGGGQSDDFTYSSGSHVVNLSLDVSGLNDGSEYQIIVKIEASITLTSSQDAQTAKTILRGDVFIDTDLE